MSFVLYLLYLRIFLDDFRIGFLMYFRNVCEKSVVRKIGNEMVVVFVNFLFFEKL